MTKARREACEALEAALALCKLLSVRGRDDERLSLERAIARMAVASTRSIRGMAAVYQNIAAGGQGVHSLPRRYFTLSGEFWNGASKAKQAQR